MLSRAATRFDACAACQMALRTIRLTRWRWRPTRCICRCAMASLDLIVTAFGFRNLANYEAGLREFHRVLKPGGRLGILDFAEPGGLVGKAYAIYFRRVLPAIGRIGRAASDGAYRYLPMSVGNFPPPAQMLEMMRGVGYGACAWQPYTFGIAGLYDGQPASDKGKCDRLGTR